MSNSRSISRRRGTAEQHESFVGANAEITVDTTNKRLMVHDGETEGGFPQATEQYVDDKASLLVDADVTFTVGSGGDFSTINGAIDFLSRKHPVYKNDGFTAEIKLLEGFVVEEQVIIKGLNLGWITITSEDSEVVVDRASLTQQFDIGEPTGDLHNPLFYVERGTLPTIGTLFVRNESGTSAIEDTGIVVYQSSKASILPGCGYKDGRWGLIGKRNGSIDAIFSVFTGNSMFGVDLSSACIGDVSNSQLSDNDVGLRVRHSICHASRTTINDCDTYGVWCRIGVVQLNNAEIKNAGVHNVVLTEASNGNCTNAEITGAGQRGILCEEGSCVDIRGATIDDNVGIGLSCRRGGTAAGSGASIKGNGTGINLFGGSTANIFNSDIEDSVGAGITANRGCTFDFSGCNVIDSGGSGIEVFEGCSGSLSGATVNGSGDWGLDAINSTVDCDGATIINSAEDNVRLRRGGSINLDSTTLTGAGRDAVYCVEGRVTVRGATATGWTRSGVRVQGAGNAAITDSDLRKEGSTSDDDIVCLDGSIVNKRGTTQAGTNIAVNDLTPNGIIFDS